MPNDELAKDAGLEVENGVVVDAFGRTGDPAIFAAGDVTNHPNALFGRRLRLELVHNAMEQAKAVARAIAGQPQAYADVPWFWSDQYDLKLQIAGVGDPEDELILRGDPATRAFSCLHLRDGRLVAIDCINRGADFLAGKKLIAERRRPRPCSGERSRGKARGAVRSRGGNQEAVNVLISRSSGAIAPNDLERQQDHTRATSTPLGDAKARVARADGSPDQQSASG